LLEHKSTAFQQEISLLINEVSKERALKELLTQKVAKLTEQLQHKIKYASDLAEENLVLRSETARHRQLQCPKERNYNSKIEKKVNIENEETPSMCSLAEHQDCKRNFLVSQKTTLPSNTHQDYLYEFTESITFCESKKHDNTLSNSCITKKRDNINSSPLN
jgi:non-ribosomal peptide synthetase component E (peptide arylation enzyme)